MESLQELIPFAKEMLRQKSSRGLLKVYLVGSVFTVLATVIGLVNTICHPFSSGEPVDVEMILMLAKEQRTIEAETQRSLGVQGKEEEEDIACENEIKTHSMTLSKTHESSLRSMANRLHAT